MMFAIFLFILGLVIGSFLNSFLWRYQTKTTFKGRSLCPACKHQLAWYDNIPLISWFMLSAKCRYCKKTISVQYPLVELITALAFLYIGIYSVPGQNIIDWVKGVHNYDLLISNNLLILNLFLLFLLLFISALLILIAVYDVKNQEIPNRFNLTFIIAACLYLFVSNLSSPFIIRSLFLFFLSGVLAFLFFWVFVFFSKETWMGGGDAKLAFGMGLLLGPLNTFLAILFSTWIGSVYGVVILIKEKKSANKRGFSHQMPFGPFLAFGTFISLLFGSQLALWYAKIFLGI